jgi:hypothetical protein
MRTHRNKNFFFSVFFAVLLLLFSAGVQSANAGVFSSSNFQILDPVISAGGGYKTSDTFTLTESQNEFVSVGTSTASSFWLFPGFLAFPTSTPASGVSASAGDGQATISWSAGEGFVGWTVSGYTIGQATNAGGPYSYSSKGNVTSTSISGLTNGTKYFFVVINEDAFGNYIATSTEASATPESSESADDDSGSSSSGGGGGGGGGTIAPAATDVFFKGIAHPNSKISLLKNSQVVATTRADDDAEFQISFSELSGGVHTFGLWGEDARGNHSVTRTFTVKVTPHVSTFVNDIFLPPTLFVDKKEVRYGDAITLEGFSAPKSLVTVFLKATKEFSQTIESDELGFWTYDVDTSVLTREKFTSRARSKKDDKTSTFSQSVGFLIGHENIAAAVISAFALQADINKDRRVNLVDFSIMAFWYKKESPPSHVDQNDDGKVDLTDFSIIAFYWNG